MDNGSTFPYHLEASEQWGDAVGTANRAIGSARTTSQEGDPGKSRSPYSEEGRRADLREGEVALAMPPRKTSSELSGARTAIELT